MATLCQDALLVNRPLYAPCASSSRHCSCVRLGLPAETGARGKVLWRRGTMRALAVSGLVQHAAKAAVQEVVAAKGLYHRLRVAIVIAVVFFQEAKGLLGALPAVIYSLHLHGSLPGLRHGKAGLFDLNASNPGLPAAVVRWSKDWVLKLASHVFRSRFKRYNASVVRDVRFGEAERNVLDVYVPQGHAPNDSIPVVVFVHGGVWAMGDKWQYSALGACLADHGVLAVVVQYTLYPEVLACEQVKEVSRALSWTFDNILGYGGDPSRVFLMGHSAGAHLSALVLWERANLLLAESEQGDGRQPHCYIGLAGVYDIAEHYKYEHGRGVAALSCMKPAIGGPGEFSAMSPTILFRSLHEASSSDKKAHGLPPCYLYASQADTVVPAESSIAFCKVLVDVGCNARIFLHDSLLHDDFGLWDKGWLSETRCGPLVKDVLAILACHDAKYAIPMGSIAGAEELQIQGKQTAPGCV